LKASFVANFRSSESSRQGRTIIPQLASLRATDRRLVLPRGAARSAPDQDRLLTTGEIDVACNLEARRRARHSASLPVSSTPLELANVQAAAARRSRAESPSSGRRWPTPALRTTASSMARSSTAS
jgi:hypothetical protein